MGEREAARVGKWGMGIRKESATVTRRFSGSPGFALMPLGFKNQRLLAREWHLYRRRRFDTFHRPDFTCVQLGPAGWQLPSVPTFYLVPRPLHRPALVGAPGQGGKNLTGSLEGGPLSPAGSPPLPGWGLRSWVRGWGRRIREGAT